MTCNCIDSLIRHLEGLEYKVDHSYYAIENFFDIIKKLEQEVKDMKSKEVKPYTCPVCNGRGFKYEVNHGGAGVTVPCNPCDKKGIIWR